MRDRVKQDHSHLWGPALSQIIGRDDDWWTCFCRQGGLSRQHQGLRYLGSTLTQSSDHAVAWTQPCICFGSASGLRQRTNDLRLTSGPCGGRKEGPQGCNGSVNPLALRQRGTIMSLRVETSIKYKVRFGWGAGQVERASGTARLIASSDWWKSMQTDAVTRPSACLKTLLLPRPLPAAA